MNKFEQKDLDFFMENIYFPEISSNNGGMKTPDQFTFHLILKRINPKIVIECGSWNHISTKVARKTLPDAKIICSDPRKSKIPDNLEIVDYTGDKFIDFENIKLEEIRDDILVFFDDHQNQARRLIQCKEKGIKHIIFNDNWPVNIGSNFSLEHLYNNDKRNIFFLKNQLKYSINILEHIDIEKKNEILEMIDTYCIIDNIFDGRVRLKEGTPFTKGKFRKNDRDMIKKYRNFYQERATYCWNTYVKLF